MAAPDCSVASLQVGEALAGTAVESVQRWLLLEVTDPWAPKALQTEALSAEVRAKLADFEREPGCRLQLIRRPGRVGKRPLCMQVSSAPGRLAAAGRELDAFEDLLDLDLDQQLGEPAPPIWLVCVHGRRDRCCALHGSAVFRAMNAKGAEVWQTSHLGGHRFAACALSLPDGLMYGRLRAEHAADLLAAHEAGQPGELELLRGRCAYDRPTQAAEIFLHRRLGVRAIDAIEWLGTEAEDQGTWETRFRTASGDETVRVRREETDASRPVSCGGELERVARFVEL